MITRMWRVWTASFSPAATGRAGTGPARDAR